MEDIHTGDKVVVRVKDAFTTDNGGGKARVLGDVVFASPKGTFSVVNVGKYNVTYWNNEIMEFDPNKFKLGDNNRVELISPSSNEDSDEAEEEEQ